MDVCTATLLVLIDAGKQRAPVFLPVRQTSSDHPHSPADSAIYRVTATARRPGDTVGRVLAIDLDRPSVPVTYHVIRDTACDVTCRAFDVTQSGGVMSVSDVTAA